MTISAFIELIRGPIDRHDWDVVRRAGPYVDAVLGSGLIKSTIREQRRGRQRPSNFAPACRSGLRCV
jgi:hypothetical protein